MPSVPYQTFVPVANLFLKNMEELQIGRVKFVPMQAALPLVKKVIHDTMAHSEYTMKERKHHTQTLNETLDNFYSPAPTCALVKADSDLPVMEKAIQDEQKYMEDMFSAQPLGMTPIEVGRLAQMAQAELTRIMQQRDAQRSDLRDRAEAEVNQCLDLLRCYTHILFGREARLILVCEEMFPGIRVLFFAPTQTETMCCE